MTKGSRPPIGRRPRFASDGAPRGIAGFVALVLSVATAGASLAAEVGAPLTLSELLRGMRSASGVLAEFTETKQLALLSTPLEAHGVVYFLPPDRLVREVNKPGHSRLMVDGDKVRFDDEAGHKAMDLSASPIARQMIDSFVVLFNGDEKRLRELYNVEFAADGGSAWHLKLLPRSMPLSRMISSLELVGNGPHIDRMEMAEPDGDSTVTVFGKTEVDHHFGTEELAALFGSVPKR